MSVCLLLPPRMQTSRVGRRPGRLYIAALYDLRNRHINRKFKPARLERNARCTTKQLSDELHTKPLLGRRFYQWSARSIQDNFSTSPMVDCSTRQLTSTHPWLCTRCVAAARGTHSMISVGPPIHVLAWA